jgi:hypothetical protein
MSSQTFATLNETKEVIASLKKFTFAFENKQCTMCAQENQTDSDRELLGECVIEVDDEEEGGKEQNTISNKCGGFVCDSHGGCCQSCDRIACLMFHLFFCVSCNEPACSDCAGEWDVCDLCHRTQCKKSECKLQFVKCTSCQSQFCSKCIPADKLQTAIKHCLKTRSHSRPLK